MSSGLRKAAIFIMTMAVSLLLSIAISRGQSVTYYYDDLNRLLRVDYGDTVIDYTYDDVGNRVIG